MDVIKKAIVDWLREILIGGIISNLSGMFDSVNEKVGEAIVEVGKSPAAWNSSIFNMVQNLSETVMIPIAGVILAFVMTLELIQLVTDRNNLHDIDTWMFFKWSFKTAAAVLIVTNTWNIVMGIFDAAQSVVNSAGTTSDIPANATDNPASTRCLRLTMAGCETPYFCASSRVVRCRKNSSRMNSCSSAGID